jgi:hypothetical protein
MRKPLVNGWRFSYFLACHKAIRTLLIGCSKILLVLSVRGIHPGIPGKFRLWVGKMDLKLSAEERELYNLVNGFGLGINS